jgi:hypothetical protein
MPKTRTGKLFGDDCTFIAGSCMVQGVQTGVGGVPVFFDGATNASNFIYLNPSICCQNTNYNSPTMDCPIQLISSAYRKFQFTKLRMKYNPVYGNSNAAGGLGFAYLADLSIGAPSNNISSILRYECSVVAPIWEPQILDLTDFLDKSKWYTREINVTPLVNTSYGILNSIQGTLMVSTDVVSATSTTLGFVTFEYEIALMEIGPVQGSAGPSYTLSDHITDSILRSSAPCLYEGDKEGSKDECKNSSTLNNHNSVTNLDTSVSTANTPLAYRFFQKVNK